ncbi:MAG: tRNA (adenine(22)-N(1))-methyltransferase TrmK [Candidatus Omnitrophica bacterium]|nr:tRNA (adenine(22)-N(1))-methyltransferase TrmK [Candidatus Omnitrophota bacterium]
MRVFAKIISVICIVSILFPASLLAGMDQPDHGPQVFLSPRVCLPNVIPYFDFLSRGQEWSPERSALIDAAVKQIISDIDAVNTDILKNYRFDSLTSLQQLLYAKKPLRLADIMRQTKVDRGNSCLGLSLLFNESVYRAITSGGLSGYSCVHKELHDDWYDIFFAVEGKIVRVNGYMVGALETRGELTPEEASMPFVHFGVITKIYVEDREVASMCHDPGLALPYGIRFVEGLKLRRVGLSMQRITAQELLEKVDNAPNWQWLKTTGIGRVWFAEIADKGLKMVMTHLQRSASKSVFLFLDRPFSTLLPQGGVLPSILVNKLAEIMREKGMVIQHDANGDISVGMYFRDDMPYRIQFLGTDSNRSPYSDKDLKIIHLELTWAEPADYSAPTRCFIKDCQDLGLVTDGDLSASELDLLLLRLAMVIEPHSNENYLALTAGNVHRYFFPAGVPTTIDDEVYISNDRFYDLEKRMLFGNGTYYKSVFSAVFTKYLDINEGARVLDWGSGSGVLAMYAAENGAGKVVAVDIDPESVNMAEANVEKLKLQDKVTVLKSDGYARIDPAERFDRIVSFPPIVGTVGMVFDAHAYDYDAVTIEKLIAGAQTYLERDGKLIVMYPDDKVSLSRLRKLGVKYDMVITDCVQWGSDQSRLLQFRTQDLRNKFLTDDYEFNLRHIREIIASAGFQTWSVFTFQRIDGISGPGDPEGKRQRSPDLAAEAVAAAI